MSRTAWRQTLHHLIMIVGYVALFAVISGFERPIKANEMTVYENDQLDNF